MATIEGAGVELAFEERGRGPAILLVHGMAADRTVWKPTIPRLTEHHKVIAYDRRGYGGSGAPEPYERTTVAEQADDALALLTARKAAPALAVGVDLGALVLLDLALRHPGALRGAVLVDVPAFPLVPDATEALSTERAALEQALRGPGPGAAIAAWRQLRGQPPSTIAVSPRAFFADFGGQSTLVLSRRELRHVLLPMAVLDTPGAPEHVRAAGDALAALLPNARRGGVQDPVDALRALD